MITRTGFSVAVFSEERAPEHEGEVEKGVGRAAGEDEPQGEEEQK